MKMTGNILITGSDEAGRSDFAEILKDGFNARGIKATVVKLDSNSPKEGSKSVGYKLNARFDIVIIFGCLDAKKDEARYKRIARPDGRLQTFHHIKISKS